jgi:iron complex outermembrane receptor protein
MCNFPINTFSQGPLFLMGASLGWWSEDERYQVSGWVRNLTDEAYLSQTFDQSGPGMKTVLEVYGDPRTYGITVGIYFE